MIDAVYNIAEDDESSPLLPVNIGRMRIDDVEHVSRMERRCYRLPWSSSAYVTELGNPKAYYAVAKTLDGRVVGYAGIWVIMDETHFTTIAVDPEFRGMRIGERLLIHMLEYGMRHGADRATLEVREHNQAAHNLYLKYGFTDVAQRRRYYSDNGEHAVIMWNNDLFDREFQIGFQRRKRELGMR